MNLYRKNDRDRNRHAGLYANGLQEAVPGEALAVEGGSLRPWCGTCNPAPRDLHPSVPTFTYDDPLFGSITTISPW